MTNKRKNTENHSQFHIHTQFSAFQSTTLAFLDIITDIIIFIHVHLFCYEIFYFLNVSFRMRYIFFISTLALRAMFMYGDFFVLKSSDIS